MYDCDTYLRRLGYDPATGRPAAEPATLVALHKRHMEAIPFNSVGSLAVPAPSGRLVDLVDFDEDATFDSVVAAGNGGGCVQLTRLFLRLLRDLGFDADLIAGTTAEGRQSYGVEVEHMLILARVDGESWLADIGYAGPSFIEPLNLDGGGVEQRQYGCRYRLVPDGDGVSLRRRPRLGQWSTVYEFTAKVRDRSDWAPAEKAINAALAAGDDDGGLYSRAVSDGQVVLKGRRYLTVRAGIEKAGTLSDDGAWRAHRDMILAGEVG
ncbi:3-amino-5-hydroxybenzoic acid synthase [Amycolatopsis sp. WAC 01375]|uniref:arylamine N-acetyltransferase family protein n=1 Tax=Amycolatopsis sp. WAC 01375 TaxID=2203194 RepID=UPI000F7A483D|nr:arylamine N-acetyltransferase [Amycolatopsis sp. WAC 01375]RSM75245.1 3-amino-5-hydroxybenzoic acid synthase [Amycolatopsis sp. WAC 01375]